LFCQLFDSDVFSEQLIIIVVKKVHLLVLFLLWLFGWISLWLRFFRLCSIIW
jgi:hypothetical protein